MGSDIARIHRGKFAGLFQQLPFPCRCAVSAQLLSVCFLLTDNNRHCADGGEEATFASASASSEEEHDHDHDHEHAEKASSTASSAASSTMAISTKLTATAVSACHTHGETELFCMAGRDEWEVISEWDAENPPKSFDSCHAHGEEL
jgi:hypothetical protein